VKAHLNQGAFNLLLLMALCTMPFALGQRTSGRGTPGNIITVTNTNDSRPDLLRQALADVNDGDMIEFAGLARSD